jgi:hypothetical protein
MSAFLQAVKEPVARKAIRYLKETSPERLARVTVHEGRRVRHRFWQPGGGYDRNITSTAVLRAVIEYIHANPSYCLQDRADACGKFVGKQRDDCQEAYKSRVKQVEDQLAARCPKQLRPKGIPD